VKERSIGKMTLHLPKAYSGGLAELLLQALDPERCGSSRVETGYVATGREAHYFTLPAAKRTSARINRWSDKALDSTS